MARSWSGHTRRSSMLDLLGSLSVSNNFPSADLSSNLDSCSNAEPTKASRPIVRYFFALSRSLGITSRPSKTGLIVFTVMCRSRPSAVANLVQSSMAAFCTTASSRLRPLTLCANAETDAWLERSSGQTAMRERGRFAAWAIASAAAWPRSGLRTAMITVAPRRTRCFEASRPRPRFPPVTMMVWPSKSESG